MVTIVSSRLFGDLLPALPSASTPALPGTSKEGGKRGNNNQCNHNNDNICKKKSNNNNNNKKEHEYQCRCTAGVAISEVLVRHQLAKPSSALSLNVPRAMRRKPKQVYVLRHGHLFGGKTDNGICAHLVEPLEGYYEEEKGRSKGGAGSRSWEAAWWRWSGRGTWLGGDWQLRVDWVARITTDPSRT